MKDTESLHLLADLADSRCELNHGPQIKLTPQAVDYIAVPMGYNGDTESKDTLVIPVCFECVEALTGDEWTLVYCLECNSSQWISQQLSKLDYTNRLTGSHHHLISIVGCPECSGKLESLYFVD